jgi:uncharacterized phage protein (TIGR02220 family)
MTHHFEVEEAKKYGIECAIILYNIKFWIEKNKANRVHFHKERYWTYNSAKAFSELFPYLSRTQIARHLRRLEELGVIISDKFNTAGYDKTKWYSLADTDCTKMNKDCTKMDKGVFKNEQPIPDIKPNINTDNINSGLSDTHCDSNIGKLKDQLIDFDALLVLFNNITGKKFRVINKKARKQFLDILNEGYTKIEIKEAIVNCFSSDYHKDNPQYLTPEFISRMEKFEKYVFATHKKQILPSDFWVRELSDEQKKLLSDKDLATWERQKTARLMEGGRMLPIKIEYDK